MPKQQEITPRFTTKQLTFKDISLGALVYASVLGFFNDYTNIVVAKSFSTIFLGSLVLSILTFLVLKIKKRLIKDLKKSEDIKVKLFYGFITWFVMFSSKFVFVGLIDLIFGNNLNIHGFFGILAVVLIATVLQKSLEFAFAKLD
ncbi:MAG: hypothetical protein H6799_00915 [Candidatus Nomurabacteria bacterium]|nr:MAG: hypothetical protein H6799_00915 [Candidatus Nomurabacteria bacterium]HRV75862.1 hypothetical protein [Candidatus Saccharimonadales bacterium]